MRLGRWFLLALGVAAAACASTIGPVIPSIQVLVVLDSLDDTLRIIPVDSPGVMHKVVLGRPAAFDRHAMALSGQFAAIGVGATAYSYDLAGRHVVCTAANIGAGSPITALAFNQDDGNVYAAVQATNGAPHFPPSGQCGQGGGYVRGGPRSFISARGTFFVVAANAGSACLAGQASCAQSWLATSTSESSDSGTPLQPTDSIPLSPPGNAQGAVLASDGLLYVLNAGNGQLGGSARLSQVSPTSRVELSVIAGFGTQPKSIATDGDRVFVASAAEGLMVYNTRTGQIERSSATAIPLVGVPRGLAVDDVGRVYALILHSCGSTTQPGQVSIFGADLISRSPVTVGTCPVAIGVTDIPSTLYNFPPN